MISSELTLRFFMDEGVPRSAGQALQDAGYEVIFLQVAIAPGSPDPLVCAASQANSAILVAHDGDMKRLAQRRGLGQRRFRLLSLIKLSCRESTSAARLQAALSLIEHEWAVQQDGRDRRIFLDIGNDVIRTYR